MPSGGQWLGIGWAPSRGGGGGATSRPSNASLAVGGGPDWVSGRKEGLGAPPGERGVCHQRRRKWASGDVQGVRTGSDLRRAVGLHRRGGGGALLHEGCPPLPLGGPSHAGAGAFQSSPKTVTFGGAPRPRPTSDGDRVPQGPRGGSPNHPSVGGGMSPGALCFWRKGRLSAVALYFGGHVPRAVCHRSCGGCPPPDGRRLVPLVKRGGGGGGHGPGPQAHRRCQNRRRSGGT